MMFLLARHMVRSLCETDPGNLHGADMSRNPVLGAEYSKVIMPDIESCGGDLEKHPAVCLCKKGLDTDVHQRGLIVPASKLYSVPFDAPRAMVPSIGATTVKLTLFYFYVSKRTLFIAI